MIPGWGRSPGEENGNRLQYSCLENSTDSGAWRARVHRIAKSRRRQRLTTHFFTFDAGGAKTVNNHSSVQFSLSVVSDSLRPYELQRQASLSITNSRSPLKPMSIELVIPSNHLILCRPLLPSIFPSIRVFSNESPLHMRWPKYWSFSFNISPTND